MKIAIVKKNAWVALVVILYFVPYLSSSKSHCINEHYLLFPEDTTADSLNQKQVDSLEKQLYNYYVRLYDCEQTEEQINNVIDEIAKTQNKIILDSVTAESKLRSILVDTNYIEVDSTKWILAAKDIALIPDFNQENDSLLTVRKDSINKNVISYFKSKNQTKQDSIKLVKELEVYGKAYKKRVQSYIELSALNKEQFDLIQKKQICSGIKDSINNEINDSFSSAFSNLINKDSGSVFEKTYKNKRYLLFKYTYDINQDSLELCVLGNNSKAPRTIKTAWDQFNVKKQQPVFIMNAGMYKENYSAQGLLVENGKIVNYLDANATKGKSGNFYLYPNGVFFIKDDGSCYLKTTVDFIKEENTSNSKDSIGLKKIKFATQSGPMFVVNKKIHKAFNPASKNVNIRNGIGIRKNNKSQEIYMVISQDQVNFHEMASFFKDVLQCENALYLDGVVSRMYLQYGKKQKGLLDNSMGLGPLIIVTKKTPDRSKSKNK